ncbi:hypothetical protein [Desulfitibacter alkalitolerans]|uniref:hypothetical protein n=1 Tax=Desulfitibacter alkalitolerans TaxID=264641 RepID=UPI00048719A9|nr:hypothetical protein [Desulfitibacter alkalitolerans]
MTHSLHRIGGRFGVEQDFVVLCMPSKDINHVGSGPKLRKFLEMAIEHGAVNVGDARLGNEWWHGSREKFLDAIEDRAVVTACFSDKEKLVNYLKALKEADLGLSVVVQGIFESVKECCGKAGLKLHTENRSLKMWGNTELLPPEDILTVTTMCGHAMVPAQLVEYMIKRVRNGSISAEDAALELAKPCMCGIFNIERAALILKELSKYIQEVS